MRVIDVTPLPPRDPEPRSPSSHNLLALGSACVLFALVGWRLASARSAPGATNSAAVQTAPAAARGQMRADEQENIDLFKRNSSSVVHITNSARFERRFRDPVDMPIGSGTGFVWDTEGHIVTNYHVVAQPDRGQSPHYFVRFAGLDNEYEAELVGVEPHKDIAVLHLNQEPPARLRPITVGESGDLQVGQKVFAIGNPFGLDQTLTTGIISGLDREIRSLTNHKISGVIQTDAAINPGNSGGPLLDSSGRLIGVNTAIVSPSGAYAGIGFAVPVDIIRHAVPELIVHGKVSRPGLGIVPMDDDMAARFGLTGVGILDVNKDSAADRAGLRSAQQSRGGDYSIDEIVGIDGVDITSRESLFDVLDQKSAGQVVRLKVRRGARLVEIPVTLQWID